MTTKTRTITGTTKAGQNVEIKITRTLRVQDKIGYADGWNINLGKEIIDQTKINMYVDGKYQTGAYRAPEKLTPSQFDRSAAQYIAMGGYARLGDAIIKEARYNEIMAAIAEMEAELTTPEVEQMKAEETARQQAAEAAADAEAAEYARQIKNGLCPKCRTYCYGDCEAN